MKNGRYWPYLIIGSIIFMVIVCVYTVYLSFDYPVDEDESYFLKYQEVEKNYANIKNIEEEFLKYFDINIMAEKTILDITKTQAFLIDNGISFKVNAKENLKTSDIQVKAKLTRPHTKKFDKLIDFKYDDKNELFYTNLDNLENGRWTLLIEFKINDLFKFYKLELCKNRCKQNN
ncbi:FixH family protein [Campylobacter sp. MG1]|uniref:FixH family protein n=1 Tax=Campylobacter sp. MG1 TaxID=2976332 RepID=UPI00226D3593|nr:FixH family protein [Campylobacter sp. MG1]